MFVILFMPYIIYISKFTVKDVNKYFANLRILVLVKIKTY